MSRADAIDLNRSDLRRSHLLVFHYELFPAAMQLDHLLHFGDHAGKSSFHFAAQIMSQIARLYPYPNHRRSRAAAIQVDRRCQQRRWIKLMTERRGVVRRMHALAGNLAGG